MSEDEMAGWCHRLSGHEFEQTQGDGEGQGSLVCYSPWGCKESDMISQLNNNQVTYFSGGTVVKNLPANARDTKDSGSIPGSGRSPREGNGNQLQYSCLENPMDRGAWWATVHGGCKSQTRLKRLSSSSSHFWHVQFQIILFGGCCSVAQSCEML